jgi:hypothetical protein|tara:strand:- start:806 stop:1765 length:960 start_codon:yes stop_codon:yes gene_type:complete
MADEATNVLGAAKTLSGLMQGLTSEPAPAEPEQTTEEVVEEPTEDNIPVEDVEEVEVAEATDDAEQDINESSEEPSYTVKVDGSEMEVTLDELLRGYQREADYTRKTSELSLEKSKYNDLMQQSQSEINNKLSKLEELTTVAQQELQQEYSRIDFEKLYEEDPSEAARLEHKMRKRAENLAMIQEETKANQQQEFQKYLQEQQHKVSTLVPEFNDPAKASKLKSDMRVYLSKLGYGEKDINSIYDARQVLLIRDAMAYDALKKSNAKVTKKVANAPKVVKSGIAKNKTDASSKLRRDKLNRLKKTGAAKDAASIFKDYL